MKTRLTVAFMLTIILAVGLVMTACNTQKSASKNTDIAGEYALISVDGKPVPTEVSHEGATLQVRSGTFTINADGTCGTQTIFIPPSGEEVKRDVTATYTRDGSTLEMTWKGAGKTVGTIQGNTFTMDNEGIIFIFRK